MQVGLRDFKVIPENRIELDLERGDAGAPTLALLDLRQHLLAVARQVAQFVQIAIYATRNHAAIGEGEWRLGHNGFLNPLAQVDQVIERLVKLLEPRRDQSSDCSLDRRNFPQ